MKRIKVGQTPDPGTFERPWYWSQPWLDPAHQDEWPWWMSQYPWGYGGYSAPREIVEVTITVTSGPLKDQSITIGPFPRREIRMVLRVVDYALDHESFNYQVRWSNEPFTPSVYGVGAFMPFWIVLLGTILGVAGGQLLYSVANDLYQDWKSERDSTVSGRRNMSGYLPSKA